MAVKQSAANVAHAAAAEFERRFGKRPTHVARAPGRVNLIGEHTDYNDGFVLPVAIDRAVWIAFEPTDDGRVSIASREFPTAGAFSLDSLTRAGDGWIEYVRGVAWALQSDGHAPRGWRGVVASNVPVGAGLSSSAALELASARAFLGVDDAPWDPPAMARAAQRAENEWVGVNCGIMDQLVSASGRAGHALLIDCRSLATRAVRIPDGATIVVLDTATRRGLVGSAYNDRRVECEMAARAFNVPALRDVSEEEFHERAGRLDAVVEKRARHIVTENARTQRAAAALDRSDLVEVGRLMNESHASLCDDFAVSRRELDVIARVAREHAACYGARMTGAGFGGCAVALVRAGEADAFAEHVTSAYAAETGLTPTVYVCAAADGASIEV